MRVRFGGERGVVAVAEVSGMAKGGEGKSVSIEGASLGWESPRVCHEELTSWLNWH